MGVSDKRGEPDEALTNDIEFDWDDVKALSNLRDHRVDFLEAMTVFADPLTLTDFDDEHSDDEDRFVSAGQSKRGRLLLVVHTFAEIATHPNAPGEAPYTFVRIISAREPTPHERRRYESGASSVGAGGSARTH